MNVPAHGHGRGDGLDVGFLHQERPHDEAEVLHVGFGEVPTLSELGEVEVGIKMHGRGRGRRGEGRGRWGSLEEETRWFGGGGADSGVVGLKEGLWRREAGDVLVLRG